VLCSPFVKKTKNNMASHKISEIEIIYRPQKYSIDKVMNSQQAEVVFRDFWDMGTIEYFEEFKVMYLNRGNQVLGIYTHSKGGLVGAICDIRMIFQAALKANAHTIIVAHNHPSGNLEPSQADKDITRKIKEAGKVLEIPITDHLILTHCSYLSFADNGYL
jgi:DNA repair protein RadC